MSLRSDMREAIREALTRGWKIADRAQKKSSHVRLEWRDGTRITTASTPSDHHAVKNFKADLKRTERARPVDFFTE